jgi:four helix bundle protein
MQDFRNLTVWQAARTLTKSVYETTSGYPRTETFGLSAQMRRAAVSICANIAEGRGRGSDGDYRRFLLTAMGSACELECEVVLSVDLGLMPVRSHDRLIADVAEVKRMLSALVRTLHKPAHSA